MIEQSVLGLVIRREERVKCRSIFPILSKNQQEPASNRLIQPAHPPSEILQGVLQINMRFTPVLTGAIGLCGVAFAMLDLVAAAVPYPYSAAAAAPGITTVILLILSTHSTSSTSSPTTFKISRLIHISLSALAEFGILYF